MISKAILRELAKRLALESEGGAGRLSTRGIGDSLASEPGAVVGLIELFAREVAKKRPSMTLSTAYALMLGDTLEVVRMGVERSLPEALVTAEAARARLLELARSRALDGPPLHLLLRQFTHARLDPGEALRAFVGEQAVQPAPQAVTPPVGEARSAVLGGVADAFRGDPFLIHAEMAQQLAAYPDALRGEVVSTLLAAPDARLREAAVGWLLDEGPLTRAATAELLRRSADGGALSGVMLRRMITLRNWLPLAERPALDAAILAARQAGVECETWPQGVVRDVRASGFDGSGAQSVMAVVKDGRRHATLAILLKLSMGVRDVWVRPGLAVQQARSLLDRMDAEVSSMDSSLDYLRLALPHFLARGLERECMPEFALVDAVERLGLAAFNPEPLSPAQLVAQLLDAAPAAARTPAEVARAMVTSGLWERRLPFLSSWFEDDARLLAPVVAQRLSRSRRHALLIELILPGRRDWWAELIAWTALSLKVHAPLSLVWVDLALVAREILDGRPLSEIPIMHFVAAETAVRLRKR